MQSEEEGSLMGQAVTGLESALIKYRKDVAAGIRAHPAATEADDDFARGMLFAAQLIEEGKN